MILQKFIKIIIFIVVHSVSIPDSPIPNTLIKQVIYRIRLLAIAFKLIR